MAIIYEIQDMEDEEELSYEWEDDEGEEEDWGEDLPDVYFWAVALSTVVGGPHIFWGAKKNKHKPNSPFKGYQNLPKELYFRNMLFISQIKKQIEYMPYCISLFLWICMLDSYVDFPFSSRLNNLVAPVIILNFITAACFRMRPAVSILDFL